MKNEPMYRTRDMFIAAYLHIKGEPLVSLESSDAKRSQYWFIFNNTDNVKKLLNEYLARKGSIIPIDYKNAIEFLKEQLEEAKHG